MMDHAKVSMKDFELLKVLGTGGLWVWLHCGMYWTNVFPAVLSSFVHECRLWCCCWLLYSYQYLLLISFHVQDSEAVLSTSLSHVSIAIDSV